MKNKVTNHVKYEANEKKRSNFILRLIIYYISYWNNSNIFDLYIIKWGTIKIFTDCMPLNQSSFMNSISYNNNKTKNDNSTTIIEWFKYINKIKSPKILKKKADLIFYLHFIRTTKLCKSCTYNWIGFICCTKSST